MRPIVKCLAPLLPASGDLFTAWRSGDGSAGGVDGGGDCAGGAGAAAGGQLHLDQALGAVAMVASPPPPAAPNEPPISLRDLEMLCVLVGGSDFQQQQVARLHSHRTHAAFASATWHALTCYLAERTVYRIYVSFCTLMGYAPDEPSRRQRASDDDRGRRATRRQGHHLHRATRRRSQRGEASDGASHVWTPLRCALLFRGCGGLLTRRRDSPHARRAYQRGGRSKQAQFSVN